MSKELVLAILAGAYLVGMVACFGPAMVESEKSANEEAAACRAVNPQNLWCQDRFYPLGAVLKAAAWPMWLSYEVAK